ncbi:C40 family peptidase [Candidatus Woesearchaeota archaeon]|nr:C40 family peptidase [Candidatus Woesearchaeota archaeon]
MKTINKKSQTGLLLWPTIAFIFALLIFFIFTAPHIDDFIGGKQAAVIRAVGVGEQELSFVDTSARLAAWQSLFELGENGGFYYDTGDLAEILPKEYPCDRYGYNLWNSKNKMCWPTIEQVKDSYAQYVDENIKTGFFSQHPDPKLATVNYEYDVQTNKEDMNTVIHGLSQDSLPIKIIYQFQINAEKTGEEKASKAEFPQGTYVSPVSDIKANDEPITKCCDGSCVVNIAENYYNKYGPYSNMHLPYVWGGETPYDIDQTKEKVKDTNSFFYGASVTDVKPPPHSDESTVPGFDCSGFLWWVYKHAGLKDFNVRKGTEYETYAKEKGYELICGPSAQTCTLDLVKEKAQPGDVLFKHASASSSPNHVAIYIGNGNIMDSSGDKNGIDKQPLPEKWLNYLTIYRFPYNTGCPATGTTAPTMGSSQLKLGDLSEKYESGGRGSDTIGYDVNGKTSYGKFQIASGTGTMNLFLNFISSRNQALYTRLKSSGDPNCEYACQPQECYLSSERATLCSPEKCYVDCEFAKAWKDETQKGSFSNDIEWRFIKATNYDPALNGVRSLCKGLDINQRSFALQNVLWSTAVQHGAYSAPRIFQRAGASPDKSDEEIIKAVYAERKKVNKYFSSSSTEVKFALKQRFDAEEKTALEWFKGNYQGAIEPTDSSVPYFTSKDIGYYYVNPSFTAEVSYDMDVYEGIAAWARKAYETCSGKQTDLTRCIEAEKKKQNDAVDAILKSSFSSPIPDIGGIMSLANSNMLFKFESTDSSLCDGKEKSSYFKFIETFENCLDYKRQGCYCEFLPEALRFLKINVSAKRISLYNKQGAIIDYYDISAPEGFRLLHNGQEIDYMIIKGSSIITEAYKDGVKIWSGSREKFYFIKSKDGFDDFTLNLPDIQKCNLLGSKHKFRFCAIPAQQIPKYDASKEKISFKEVPIKFALDLTNPPPPPITQLGSVPVASTPEQEAEVASAELLPQEKKCEGIGKAEFKLTATTKDLKPAYENFISNLATKVVPQLGVLLFAKNFFVMQNELPALINVELNFKGASDECDITGLVYKCGLGVPPFKDSKFDFSEPTGYIDLSSKFKASSELGCGSPDSCFSFNNPDGSPTQSQIRCTKPQMSQDKNVISFSVSKCTSPILQYKKMSGLDVITAALNGFGYYFAFAYVDGAGNYGEATIEGIQLPSVLKQLEEQLGLENILLLKSIIMGNYNDVFGLLGLNDEFQFIRNALAGASLDRIILELEDEARSAVYGELSKNIKNEDAAEIVQTLADDAVNGRLENDYAQLVTEKLIEELDISEVEKIMDKIADSQERADALVDYLESLTSEKKAELLDAIGEEVSEGTEGRVEVTGYAVSMRVNTDDIDEKWSEVLEDKNKVAEILKNMNPQDQLELIKNMAENAPKQMLKIAADSVGADKKIEAIRSILGEASGKYDNLLRMIANLSPDYAKKAALDYVMNLPGFDQYKDIISIFEDFKGVSC